MTIVFIALLHGVPVIVIGICSNSKTLATLSALFAAFIAVTTGSATYTFADLLAVFAAYAVVIYYINDNKEQSTSISQPSLSQINLKKEKKRQRFI
jgi:hypothetical protein